MINGNNVWSSSILPSSISEINLQAHQSRINNTPLGIYDALVRAADRFPSKIALELETGETFTFAQLLEETQEYSAKLASFGVKNGSKVGLLLDNDPSIFIALYAVNQIGATAVMLPGKQKTPALINLLNRVNPTLTLIANHSAQELQRTSHLVMTIEDFLKVEKTTVKTIHPTANQIALLMFTSGTSGTPKVVAISNENIAQAALSYELVFGLNENDKLVFGVPLYHVTGVVAVIAQITFSGCSLYLQRRFSPVKFLEWSKEIGATYIHASPTVFELLLRAWPEGLKIPTIRVLACGAASMPTSRILRLREKLPNAEFRTVYGLTETTSPATIFPSDAAQSEFIGSSGWPIPGNEVRIIDKDGSELRNGEVGEIEIRGATVCLGYLNEDGEIDRLSSLKTGDLGYLNEHGLLYVVDRKKDQINRGGEKVYPHIVEEALTNIDGITDACVVAVEDDLYGEIPGAIFVSNSWISTERIQCQLKNSLASFAIPHVLLQVDEIPKTIGLKTDRGAARKLLQKIRVTPRN